MTIYTFLLLAFHLPTIFAFQTVCPAPHVPHIFWPHHGLALAEMAKGCEKVLGFKRRSVNLGSVMALPSPIILFRTPSLLVIDKPFGVRMDGNYENTVENMCKMVFTGKVRFIHQLDFATSGVLMLGLDKSCTARVHAHFETGEVKKEYLALLEGTMEAETSVDAPICRYEGPALLPPRGPPGTHGKSKDFRMMIGEGSAENPGRESLTHIQPLLHGIYQQRPVTRAILRPVSGRRHQLRLHTQHIGHGIVGDVTYSEDTDRARNCDRMMLHASRVEIPWHDSYEQHLEAGTQGISWGRTGSEAENRVWFCATDPFEHLVG